MKKFFKLGCGGLIALIILGRIIGALEGGDHTTEENNSTNNKIETSAKPQENAEKTETMAEEPKEERVPREYISALKKAQFYAKTMHMSKAEIYDQLTSEYGENFPAEAAQYAIDNIVFDWKENALKKAQAYAKNMHMSDSAIYDQLISEYREQFSPEEAQYAINNLK